MGLIGSRCKFCKGLSQGILIDHQYLKLLEYSEFATIKTRNFCKLNYFTFKRVLDYDPVQRPGASSEVVTPLSISNRAVKRLSADDTAFARLWDSRSAPGHCTGFFLYLDFSLNLWYNYFVEVNLYLLLILFFR